MPLTFPTSPTNGQTTTLSGTTYTYNATKGVWEATASGGGFVAGSFSEHILPSANETYDIGSAEKKIRHLFLSDNTLNIGSQSISADSEGIVMPAVTIGTGTNKVVLSATPEGGLKQAGTNSSGVAAPVSTAGGVGGTAAGDATTVADMDGLIALTGMTTGQIAQVTSLNRIFMYTGTGWFKIADMSNESPSAITGVDGSYTLATDGTATTITAVSSDPEGFPLTWSYAVTSGSLGSTATVSQTDNVFTITPSTNSAHAGTFSLTFSVTDGATGAVNAVSAFTLGFSSWTNPTSLKDITQSSIQWFGLSPTISDNGKIFLLPNSSSGSAQVYETSSLSSAHTLQSTLTAPSGLSGASWSKRVKMDGTGTVIMSHEELYEGGSITYHYYDGSSWSLQQTLSGSSYHSTQMFSSDISRDGKTFAIADSETTSYRGRIIVYTRTGTPGTWAYQATVNPHTARDNGQMGYSEVYGKGISLSDDGNVMLGNKYYYGADATAGETDVWTRSGTSWTGRYTFPEKGWMPAISGDGNTVAIGNTYISVSGYVAGRVTIYVTSDNGVSWSQQAQIPMPDAATATPWGSNSSRYYNFGGAIDFNENGNLMVVGARGVRYGKLYIYERTGTSWALLGTYNESNALTTGYAQGLGFNLMMAKDGSAFVATGSEPYASVPAQVSLIVQG